MGRLGGGNLNKGSLISDTTEVGAHLQIDKALNTPVGVPAVTNNPISWRGRLVVSSELDAVVEIRIRVRASALHHTTSVILPRLSIDANGNRAHVVQLGQQQVLVLTVARTSARRNGVAVVGHSHHGLGCAESALSIGARTARSVRIVSLGLQTASLLHIFVSSDSVTSTAASIISIARNDLLWGQNGLGMVGAQPRRLNLLSGAKGPARAALTLILHWGASTFGKPIPLGRRGGSSLDGVDINPLLLLRGGGEAKLGGLELGGRNVGELVNAIDVISILAKLSLVVLAQLGDSLQIGEEGLLGFKFGLVAHVLFVEFVSEVVPLLEQRLVAVNGGDEQDQRHNSQ